MKKILLGILSVLFFVACSSDEEVMDIKDNVSDSPDIKAKKEIILDKFKSLGLDPSKVVFTDKIDKNNVKVIKSIDELDDFLKPIEIKSSFVSFEENMENNIFTDNTNIKFNSSGVNFNNYVQYGNVYESTKVFGNAALNMRYSFTFSPFLIRNKQPDGIINVYSNITGFTLGLSYSQDSVYDNEYMNAGSFGEAVRIYIYGTLNYNIIFEGIGTFYSAPLQTRILFRLPFSRYSNTPSMIQAVSFILKN